MVCPTHSLSDLHPALVSCHSCIPKTWG